MSLQLKDKFRDVGTLEFDDQDDGEGRMSGRITGILSSFVSPMSEERQDEGERTPEELQERSDEARESRMGGLALN